MIIYSLLPVIATTITMMVMMTMMMNIAEMILVVMKTIRRKNIIANIVSSLSRGF